MADQAKLAVYKDSSAPLAERVADLVGRMTLEEKIAQLTCSMPGVERLGIPAFSWGGECLHGICNAGRATIFPQAIGMAATFDVELLHRIAVAISDEARAKFHDPEWQRTGHARLTFWTPNINIFRDPRWGRGQETYGEDPYLTGLLGAAFVRGLQGDHPKYLKAMACAKHFVVHSGPEEIRTRFSAEVSEQQLVQTYLPAFKALIEAGVASVMATYNAVNGEPCCGSKKLLVDKLRNELGFDGFVTSDAGAIDTMHQGHRFTKDAVESAGLALSLGVDMDIGSIYRLLPQALERGLVSETDIDTSLSRLFSGLFRLGLFDDPSAVPYSRIGKEVVQCSEHLALSREAATKSVVLLKNNGILPLGPELRTIAVNGPNAADIEVLLGNFYRSVSPNLKTIMEGIVERAPEGVVVTYFPGCRLEVPNTYPSLWSIGVVEWADAVVTVMGTSPLMEGESGECIASPTGGDRPHINPLPHQVEYYKHVKNTGKPSILVLTGGSPLAVGELHDLADAVLFVWYPGEQGGLAVADLLFGHESPSGRLPITFPRSMDQVPEFTDYSMRGRTYRFLTEEPLYPFGFGLSYTRFEYSGAKLSSPTIVEGETVELEVSVSNLGERDADEVVQLYVQHEARNDESPLWSLCGIQRTRIPAKSTASVRFELTSDALRQVGTDGVFRLVPGRATLHVGGASPGARSQALGAPKPVEVTLRVV